MTDNNMIITLKNVYVLFIAHCVCRQGEWACVLSVRGVWTPTESIWGTGASGQVSLAISGSNTFGLRAWGREIGVMLHPLFTLMHIWEESPSGGGECWETTQVYRASLEA